MRGVRPFQVLVGAGLRRTLPASRGEGGLLSALTLSWTNRPCTPRRNGWPRRDRRRPRRRLHNKAFPIKRTSTYLSRSAQIILLSFCTIATPEVASSSFLLLKTCYFMRLLATVPLENHRGNSLIVWPLERSIATSPLTCHGQTPLWIASSQLAPTLSFL